MASNLPIFSEEDAQQLKLDMYSLKARKDFRHSCICVHTNRTASLGPSPEEIPETFIQYYRQQIRQPILAVREDVATLEGWQLHHKAVRMASWPNPSDGELNWYAYLVVYFFQVNVNHQWFDRKTEKFEKL